MMNEKIAVAVVVNAETAKRIEREVMRQALVAELDDVMRRIKEAGLKMEIVGSPSSNATMFTAKIQIPADRFMNSKTNQYNMHVDY